MKCMVPALNDGPHEYFFIHATVILQHTFYTQRVSGRMLRFWAYAQQHKYRLLVFLSAPLIINTGI